MEMLEKVVVEASKKPNYLFTVGIGNVIYKISVENRLLKQWGFQSLVPTKCHWVHVDLKLLPCCWFLEDYVQHIIFIPDATCISCCVQCPLVIASLLLYDLLTLPTWVGSTKWQVFPLMSENTSFPALASRGQHSLLFSGQHLLLTQTIWVHKIEVCQISIYGYEWETGTDI